METIETNDFNLLLKSVNFTHCVKSVEKRSFFWSVFSCIRTEYGDLPNSGKYGPEITPYLDTVHAVTGTHNVSAISKGILQEQVYLKGTVTHIKQRNCHILPLM